MVFWLKNLKHIISIKADIIQKPNLAVEISLH